MFTDAMASQINMEGTKMTEKPEKSQSAKYPSETPCYAPCPFCGNVNLVNDYQEYDNKITHWVECPKCEIVMERDTKQQTIDDWNKRA
jgi:Lar family restriction alleviation protein